RWTRMAQAGELAVKAVGRPASRAPVHLRASVLCDLAARPRTGVRALKQRHPQVGLRELQDLKERFRSVRTTRNRDQVQALTWHLPGSVWAVDFSAAGLEIEGTYPYLLLVRDLASGCSLLALPCASQDAATV